MSWLERHFHPDQSSATRSAPSHLQQVFRQQVRTAFTPRPSTVQTASVLTTPNSTETEGPSGNTPPPAYSEVYPHGPPARVLRDLLCEPSMPRLPQQAPLDLTPRQDRDRRQERHDRLHRVQRHPTPRPSRRQTVSFEHYNIGVDPEKFFVTRVPTFGTPPFVYVCIPRQYIQHPVEQHLSDTEPDYRSPLLHRNPSMADTSNTPRTRFFLGSNVSTTLTRLSRHSQL